jgi:hypothetical protein
VSCRSEDGTCIIYVPAKQIIFLGQQEGVTLTLLCIN